MANSRALPDALYYLRNFQHAIDWVVMRNHDLLSRPERKFVARFDELSIAAQALLVRLLMRRGTLFRRSKIAYPEIDGVDEALRELTVEGWLDPAPTLTLHELFRLTTRAELAARFDTIAAGITKQDAYDLLAARHDESQPFEVWIGTHEPVYLVTIAPVVLQFRLLYFGNFYQDWHEYTLVHLQVFTYEKVAFDARSRPFETRADIEFFYALYRCHAAFNEGAALTDVIAQLPGATTTHAWLRRHWDRLRYHLGQASEREGQLEAALQLYRDNAEPDARVRGLRVLACLGRAEEARSVALSLLSETTNEVILQKVTRISARLERRAGERAISRDNACGWPTRHLNLMPDADSRVELLAQMHLSTELAPVFYVENSLLCSIFGLLCWEAIFEPVRGAFFHPFHGAPADLSCPDFVQRREAAFERCMLGLDTGEYIEQVTARFHEKYGTAAPFVHWHALDERVLQLALECISAQHLKLYFKRLLAGLSENGTGLPDLVQFYLEDRKYKLIEVKGPGDRLQDNQRRWLHYCTRHGLPVEVCQVSWASAG